MSLPPAPPLPLANRVGSLEEADDPFGYYDWLGRRAKEDILAALPQEYDLTAKRVLDFGCGAGRTLRHFLDEAERGSFSGCDIDGESIDWMGEHLSPPLTVFQNAEVPPLPVDDRSFDLIWCVSVFTHLTDHWAPWLLELHRVLDEGGLLLVTFMGEGMSEIIAGEAWDEDRIGMNVLRYGQRWDLGGPMVMHSPWWIRAHWGRAFEVEAMISGGFATDSEVGQGLVLMRKKAVTLQPADLEQPEDDEPRELEALRHELFHARAEMAQLRHDHEWLTDRLAEGQARERALEDMHQAFRDSRTWRFTAPLRRFARWGRQLSARVR